MHSVDLARRAGAGGPSARRVLVVKFGALGDVVRTSYFAEAMKRDWPVAPEIVWVTDPNAVDILRFNPYIDRVAAGFGALAASEYDTVFSLDDEPDIVREASRLSAGATLHGAFLEAGQVRYTDSSAPWFDMGLPSRFGKTRADQLKLENRSTHGEIFSGIFGVERPRFRFHHSAWARERARGVLDWGSGLWIGLAMFAGARWPAKSLRIEEAARLVERLTQRSVAGLAVRVALLGSGDEARKNEEVLGALGERARGSAVRIDTSGSVLDLAATISMMSGMITADTLAMHCSIAQGIGTVAFFTVTSAAEIDGNGVLAKVLSTAPDYCSYRPAGDNSTITAQRLEDAIDWPRVLEGRARALAA